MDTPRWHQRFDNFGKALNLLSEAVTDLRAGRLTELAREGLLQRFEYTWELAWKSLRDYFSASGITLSVPTPINVLRAGIEHHVLSDADGWINAMKARNRMAHEYDRSGFEQTITDIADRYLPMLQALAERLESERAAGN